MRSKTCATIGLATTVLLGGCQGEPDTSSVASLDNFAAGRTVTVNQCSGREDAAGLDDAWKGRIVFGSDVRTKLDAEMRQVYEADVREYLTSVPASMQRAFLALGGQVLLTEKAASLCGDPFADATSPQHVEKGREDFESCFVFAKGTAESTKDKAVFAIVHKVTAKDARTADGDLNRKRIKHGGVRAFSLLYVQLLSRMASGKVKNKLDFDAEDGTKFATMKTRLANRFLVDLSRIDGTMPVLGEGGAEKVRAAMLDGEGVIKQGVWDGTVRLVDALSFGLADDKAARRKVLAMQMEDAITAEALDSALCSDETRQTMADMFPRTASLVGDMAKLATEHATAMAAALPPLKTSAALVDATDEYGTDDGYALFKFKDLFKPIIAIGALLFPGVAQVVQTVTAAVGIVCPLFGPTKSAKTLGSLGLGGQSAGGMGGLLGVLFGAASKLIL